jgi:hypothetical protein
VPKAAFRMLIWAPSSNSADQSIIFSSFFSPSTCAGGAPAVFLGKLGSENLLQSVHFYACTGVQTMLRLVSYANNFPCSFRFSEPRKILSAALLRMKVQIIQTKKVRSFSNNFGVYASEYVFVFEEVNVLNNNTDRYVK